MTGKKALRNGELVDASALVFPLDDIDITHGYGCYETLKVRGGALYFAEDHAARLLRSAAILGIRHALDAGSVARALAELAAANGIPDCNIKLMLIGREGRDADWFAFGLPALYPPEGAAATGVGCLAFRGERQFPAAKSLSLLMSTIAFREASRMGCWDALLVNGRGELTEGTRTNILYERLDEAGRVYAPPADQALAGVTRTALAEALAAEGGTIADRPLPLSELRGGRVALMVTSTSTGIVPVTRLWDRGWLDLPAAPLAAELRGMYERRAARYASRRS